MNPLSRCLCQSPSDYHSATTLLPPSFSPHHQVVATGLQSAEADAEKQCSGEGVVVDEAATLSFTVAAVQRQVGVSVAGE